MQVPHTPTEPDRAAYVLAARATLQRDVDPHAELASLFWLNEKVLVAFGTTPAGATIQAEFINRRPR